MAVMAIAFITFTRNSGDSETGNFKTKQWRVTATFSVAKPYGLYCSNF